MMNNYIKLTLLLFSLLVSTVSLPAEDMYPFDNPIQQAAFNTLLPQLRCLVCQNQNLADSHAPLAKDLRDQVYKMVRQGQGKDEIIDYLTQRYGDFVLYNPPVKSSTMVLWFGPFLLLIIGFIVLFCHIRGGKDDTRPLASKNNL